MTAGDLTPLERLHEAIVTFARETSECDEGCSVLIPAAVVAWEEMHFQDDGQTNVFEYAQTGDTTTMSGAIGMLDLAKAKVTRDVLDDGDIDE